MKIIIRLMCLLTVAPLPVLSSGVSNSVFLEDLTWTEVQHAVQTGKTTIIFPTGGTEQNGPHMALGKHNVIVRHAARQIARRLGNALVAPVLAYVPEGNVQPPTDHMQFPGTITLPDKYFRKVTEYAARSFRASGFKNIIFIGDSGGNWSGLKAVASMLNQEWANNDVHVYYIAAFNRGEKFHQWLRQQGETNKDIGTHAGIMDTSVLMAVDPNLVRKDKLAPGRSFRETGVSGNPTRANAAYGRRGLKFQIDGAVAQIRQLTQRKTNPK